MPLTESSQAAAGQRQLDETQSICVPFAPRFVEVGHLVDFIAEMFIIAE